MSRAYIVDQSRMSSSISPAPAQRAQGSQESAGRRPLQSCISRKRYQEIERRLKEAGQSEESTLLFLGVLCEVLNFDPDDRSLSKWYMDRLRKKAAETGQSTYEVSGQKQQYHRRKAMAKLSLDASASQL